MLSFSSSCVPCYSVLFIFIASPVFSNVCLVGVIFSEDDQSEYVVFFLSSRNIYQYYVSICVIWDIDPDSLLLQIMILTMFVLMVVYRHIFHHFIFFKVNVATTCAFSTYNH